MQRQEHRLHAVVIHRHGRQNAPEGSPLRGPQPRFDVGQPPPAEHVGGETAPVDPLLQEIRHRAVQNGGAGGFQKVGGRGVGEQNAPVDAPRDDDGKGRGLQNGVQPPLAGPQGRCLAVQRGQRPGETLHRLADAVELLQRGGRQRHRARVPLQGMQRGADPQDRHHDMAAQQGRHDPKQQDGRGDPRHPGPQPAPAVRDDAVGHIQCCGGGVAGQAVGQRLQLAVSQIAVPPHLGQHGQPAPVQVGHRARRREAVQNGGEAVGLDGRSRPHAGQAAQQGLLVVQKPQNLDVHQGELFRRFGGSRLPIKAAQMIQIAEKGIVLDRLVRLRQQRGGERQRVVHPGHLIAEAGGQRVDQVGAVVAAPHGAQRAVQLVQNGDVHHQGELAGQRLRLVQGGGAAGAVAAVQDYFGQPAQLRGGQGVAVLGADARHGDVAGLLRDSDDADESRTDHRRQGRQHHGNGGGQHHRHGLKTGLAPGAAVLSGHRRGRTGRVTVGDRRYDIRYRDAARLDRPPIVHSAIPARRSGQNAPMKISHRMRGRPFCTHR